MKESFFYLYFNIFNSENDFSAFHPGPQGRKLKNHLSLKGFRVKKVDFSIVLK
jgi:hypothetical protein